MLPTDVSTLVVVEPESKPAVKSVFVVPTELMASVAVVRKVSETMLVSVVTPPLTRPPVTPPVKPSIKSPPFISATVPATRPDPIELETTLATELFTPASIKVSDRVPATGPTTIGARYEVPADKTTSIRSPPRAAVTKAEVTIGGMPTAAPAICRSIGRGSSRTF